MISLSTHFCFLGHLWVVANTRPSRGSYPQNYDRYVYIYIPLLSDWSVELLPLEGTSTMASMSFLLIVLLNVFATAFSTDKFSRHDFPSGFIFGSGTSAYQVEGAANEDGRTPSIFDTYAHSKPKDADKGDIASDQYHKYKEDVQLMVETGLDAYRFSISWSRLIPNGRGPVNPQGLAYYNNLINELVSNGIEPHVTLQHSDLPQALEDEYGGWISREVVKDFTSYAEVCFKEFGDRVKYWTTINEPNIFVQGGYLIGFTPPQRCSHSPVANCTRGNSSTEPYIAAHYLLLSHASAARLYKKRYQAKQRGLIGINLYAICYVPASNATEDIIAAKRAFDFLLGWFMEPLVFGDYPDVMKQNAGSRLPSITSNEAKLIKGSSDFVGVNHYWAVPVKDQPPSPQIQYRDYNTDMQVEILYDITTSSEIPYTPWGMQIVLEYFKQTYGNPPIFIQENGQSTGPNPALNDTLRVKYLEGYIGGVLDAVRNGSNVKGYFTWSFIDAYELLSSDLAFGLYYVDTDDKTLRRYPRLSAHWYSDFLKGGTVGSHSVFDMKNNLSADSESRSVDE